MIAVEIKAPIVNHRIDFSSDKLPSNVEQAKIIVMFDAPETTPATPDVVALARAARASFPKGNPTRLRGEFDAMRAEWGQRAGEK